MDYQTFKELMDAVPERDRHHYSKLRQYACIGGNVWPEYKEHLEAASTLKEFFDALYEDDKCRFSNAWAYWARMQHKDWTDRFEPERMMRDVSFTANGILVEKDDLELVFALPVVGRRKRAHVIVVKENGFNEALGEQVASLNGTFTCAGMELSGTYDVFATDRALVFEEWAFDSLGYRQNNKRASKSS